MKFFKKLFGKKLDDGLDFAPLPIPKVRNKISNMNLGKLKIVEQIGEIYQAMPNRRAQIWQAISENGDEEFIATVLPGQENQKWVESRLGKEGFRVKSWKAMTPEGSLRKQGRRLNVLKFDTVINDRYIIKKRLVKDSLVEMYKAWDEKQNAFVYVTIFLPQKNIKMPSSFSPRTFEVNKKQNTLLIKSPNKNILNVTDEGLCKPTGIFFPYRFKIPSIYYVITEYCSDINFIHFMDTWRRHLPLENMLSILAQLVSIITWLNNNSWVHGNIRPEQLWFATEGNNEGKLYLNGFSLIKKNEDRESTAFELIKNTGGCGVMSYISPEQVAYENVNCHCDQFTMGMILAEFALGKHPFKGLSDREIARRLKKSLQLGEDANIPIWLSKIIDKCLSENASDRFENINDVLDEVKCKWQEMELGATGDVSTLFDDEDESSISNLSIPLSIVNDAPDPLATIKTKEKVNAQETKKKISKPKVIKKKIAIPKTIEKKTATPKTIEKKVITKEKERSDDFFEEEDFLNNCEEEFIEFEQELNKDTSIEKKVEKKVEIKKKRETKKSKPIPMAFPKPKPKTKTDSNKPKTRTDSNKPRTKTDTNKPKTHTDSNKPRTKTDSNKRTDSNKPRTKIDSDKPRTRTDSNKPRTKIDSYKPRTRTDSNKPRTKIDSYKTKSKTDFNKLAVTKIKKRIKLKKSDKEGLTSSPTDNLLENTYPPEMDQFVNEDTAMMEILEKTSSLRLGINLESQQQDHLRMTATDEFVDDQFTEEDSQVFEEMEDENFDDWVFEEEDDEFEEDDDWDIMEATGKKDAPKK